MSQTLDCFETVNNTFCETIRSFDKHYYSDNEIDLQEIYNMLFVKFSELQAINSKNLNKLKEAEHDKNELIGELSDSLDLCKTLKCENHVLANKVGSLENELKESKTLLEKFSNDNLDKFLHTQKSTCDKLVSDFDKIIAPSFNLASSSKKVFVET
jgi:hypothetical protein